MNKKRVICSFLLSILLTVSNNFMVGYAESDCIPENNARLDINISNVFDIKRIDKNQNRKCIDPGIFVSADNTIDKGIMVPANSFIDPDMLININFKGLDQNNK